MKKEVDDGADVCRQEALRHRCGAVAGAERKTSAAEVEPPQVRRASKADDQRSGLSWGLTVACWGQWTCGCSRAVRIVMSKGGFAGQ